MDEQPRAHARPAVALARPRRHCRSHVRGGTCRHRCPGHRRLRNQVFVECYLGDEVAVSNHTSGALMKLANYPEPALRFWVPELSVGLFCLAVWVGLFLWRRHLFKTLVMSSIT